MSTRTNENDWSERDEKYTAEYISKRHVRMVEIEN